jgi:hypothetical protein
MGSSFEEPNYLSVWLKLLPCQTLLENNRLAVEFLGRKRTFSKYDF